MKLESEGKHKQTRKEKKNKMKLYNYTTNIFLKTEGENKKKCNVTILAKDIKEAREIARLVDKKIKIFNIKKKTNNDYPADYYLRQVEIFKEEINKLYVVENFNPKEVINND